MKYFERDKIISNFITIFKEKFKDNDDYHHLGSLYARFPDYEKIRLISVDENIALWSMPYYYRSQGHNYLFYFYSDLKGNILFDETLFAYATPFSSGCALVREDLRDEWYVINLNTKERVLKPANLGWGDLTDFRNNTLAICDGNNGKWGSYTIDFDEHLWQVDIPFIWDYLTLSRDPNLVYAGLDHYFIDHPNWEYGPYNHMIPDRYEVSWLHYYKVALLKREEAKNLDVFKELEKHIEHYFWARGERTKYIPEGKSNVGDGYFNEKTINTGQLVDVGSLSDYPKILSKIKK